MRSSSTKDDRKRNEAKEVLKTKQHVAFENWATDKKPNFLTDKKRDATRVSSASKNRLRDSASLERNRSALSKTDSKQTVNKKSGIATSKLNKAPSKALSKSVENLSFKHNAISTNKVPWHYAKSSASYFPKRDALLKSNVA